MRLADGSRRQRRLAVRVPVRPAVVVTVRRDRVRAGGEILVADVPTRSHRPIAKVPRVVDDRAAVGNPRSRPIEGAHQSITSERNRPTGSVEATMPTPDCCRTRSSTRAIGVDVDGVMSNTAIGTAAASKRNDVDAPRSGRRREVVGRRRGDSRAVGIDDDPVGVAKANLRPIHREAGDREADARSLVRRTKPVPLARMAQMSRLPGSISHSKAMVSPSGDQAGCPTNPMLWVSPGTSATDQSARFSTTIEGLLRADLQQTLSAIHPLDHAGSMPSPT